MVSTPCFEGLLVDVAQRDAAAVIDVLEVLQQVAAAAAGADHAELHLIVRGPDFLNGGSALHDGIAAATAVTAPAVFNKSRRERSLSCAIRGQPR